MKITTRRVLIVFTLIINLFYRADAQIGQIWGVTSREGTNNIGTIFKMDGEGNNFTIQKNFLSESQGINPESAPTIAHNGKLYGVTRFGGSHDRGVIYEFDPTAKTYLKKIDFTGANGRNPRGTLLQATNGKLYGVAVAKDATEVTGPYEIFEYDPISNSIRALFKSAESKPFSSLIQASNGKIYGIGTQELVELDPVSGFSQSWQSEFQFPFRNYYYNSSYFKVFPQRNKH